MKTQSILTIIFFFSLTLSFASVLESKLHTKWSLKWRVEANNNKIKIFSNVDECEINCKYDKIDCLRVNKWPDQVGIISELNKNKIKYNNEAICYYKKTPSTDHSNYVEKNGNASSNYTGFKNLFKESDICNSFCQTFYDRLCETYSLRKGGRRYGCRYIA